MKIQLCDLHHTLSIEYPVAVKHVHLGGSSCLDVVTLLVDLRSQVAEREGVGYEGGLPSLGT